MHQAGNTTDSNLAFAAALLAVLTIECLLLRYSSNAVAAICDWSTMVQGSSSSASSQPWGMPAASSQSLSEMRHIPNLLPNVAFESTA